MFACGRVKLQPNIDVSYHQSSCFRWIWFINFCLLKGGTRLIGVRQRNQIWLSSIISKLFHWWILVKFCYYNFWESTWKCLLVGGWNLTDQGPAEHPNIDFQISPVKFVQIKICELLKTKLKKKNSTLIELFACWWVERDWLEHPNI